MTVRQKQSLGGMALVVLAVLFVALAVATSGLLRGARLDLTESGLYTLSEGTGRILENLEEPINLYFFYSRRAAADLPWLRSYAERVREMLEEFSAEAGDELRLQVIDPLPFSEDEERAAGFGLEPVSLGAGNDPIYFGLAGTNATDGLETIAFLQPDREAFLEYDLARLVWSLAHPERPVVGLVSGLPMGRSFDPQRQRPTEPWLVTSQIEQLFELRDLGASPESIGEDVDLLLLVHPRELGPAAQYAVDQFVMRGGKLVAFVDPNAQSQAADPLAGQSMQMFESRASDLGPLAASWGFRFDAANVVVDLENALMVNTGQGVPVRHLAMLGLGEEDLAGDDVITGQLDTVNLATPGHLEPVEDAGSRFVPLLTSSAESMLVAASRFGFLPDPGVLLDEFVPAGREHVLGARIEGELASAFPDGPPEGVETQGEHRARSDGEVSLVVFADTDLLTDRMWVQVSSFLGQRVAQAFAANGALVTNALENLAGSQDLISVRSRGSFSRPFERVEALRREAETRFRAQEQRLERELDETERKLAELQSARQDKGALLLTPEQQAEIQRFEEENLRIRRDLREVRRELDASIENLGTTLKVINIGLVPLLVSLAAVAAALWRSRRRRQARELAA